MVCQASDVSVLQQRRASSNFLQDVSLAEDADMTFTWRRLYYRVKLIMLGQSDTLPRTANLVQVLGNMTVILFTLSAFIFIQKTHLMSRLRACPPTPQT